MSIAVIIVGYNRLESIVNLSSSLSRAEYGRTVDLIFSIDKGRNQQKIVDFAENFEWPNGSKRVRAFRERQGLRKHVVQCGDLTDEYDSVVVLEDDLEVSPYFLSYVQEMIEAYGDDPDIAGISLYKHEQHPGVCRPFEPAHDGTDVFLMQYAMSWGQCWTRSMWRYFREWYGANEDADLSRGDLLPAYISGWNGQSWLKYYMRYLVETGKYFIYPRVSLATNSSDVGEHCAVPNNDYQTSLLDGPMMFRVAPSNELMRYDVFFERMGISEDVFPKYEGRKLLDLYGCRGDYGDADYLISTRRLPYRVLESVQLKYRPIECNCLRPVPGNGIYLYSLKDGCGLPDVDNRDTLTRYEVRSIHWKRLLHLGLFGFADAVKRKIAGGARRA